MSPIYIAKVTGEYDDNTREPLTYYFDTHITNPICKGCFLQNINSNVIIFIHGFNFQREYAIEVFNRMVNKFNIDNHYMSFVCILWNSSANDTDERACKLFNFISNYIPGAVGDEIYKIGNSGLIYDRYVGDLERVADSFRGISWLINDIAKMNKKIHLIGHSMGCQAVLNSLSFMCHDNKVLKSQYYGGPYNAAISEGIVQSIINVFLIAPDVNTGIFKLFVVSDMQILTNLKKFVIYANNNDIAIYASKLIRVHNHRLGNPKDTADKLREISEYNIQESINKIDVLDIETRNEWHAIKDVLFALPLALMSSDYPLSHNYYTDDSICNDIRHVIIEQGRPNVYISNNEAGNIGIIT